jgi:O-antigen ligase
MGLVLSVLYFVTYYLTPPVVFGPLAAPHFELILAVLVFSVSVLKVMGSYSLKTPQSLALLGLAIAIFLSAVIGQHWFGGGVEAFIGFLTSGLAYFFVCLHFNSKRKLQVLVLMLLFVCLFVIGHGAIDLLLHGEQRSDLHLPTQSYQANAEAWRIEHPYLLPKPNDADEPNRLKGLGEINDPNDFGQLTVCVIPLVFIFWRPKKLLKNIALVILPACGLLLGVFLAHSRGALVGLIAVAIVAARRRIGTLPALVVAGVLFAAAMALNFTGGRNISANAGEDRTALWGESLQAFKSHPLFGVGVGAVKDYTDTQHTSHNSVAVCAAENGLVGLFFWSLFLFSTFRDTLAVASPRKVSEGEPQVVEESQFPQMTRKIEELDKAEVNRLGRLMVLSLTGFAVTAWFLSRAFVLTLFLLGGMAEVVFQMALQRGMIAPRLPMGRVLAYSGVLAFSLVLVLYIMVRILNVMH